MIGILLKKWLNRKRWLIFALISIMTAKKQYFKIATDNRIKQKIYQFRYKIYYHELNRNVAGLKKDLGVIVDEYDEQPNTLIFYLQAGEEIIATIRAILIDQEHPESALLEDYNVTKYTWFMDYKSCELGRFMVAKNYRSSLVVLRFVLSVMSFLVFKKGIRISLISCKPYLTPYYMFLGFMPYTQKLITYPDGIEIPLIAMVDNRYLKETNAVAQYTYRDINTISAEHVDILLKSIHTPILSNEEINNLLDNLRKKIYLPRQSIFNHLLNYGSYGLEIKELAKLIHKEMVDRTIYLILEGNVQILKNNKVIELGPGQIIGEFAYFLPKGKRMAEVICKNAKFLVIRKSSIEQLAKSYPHEHIELNQFIVCELLKKFIDTVD